MEREETMFSERAQAEPQPEFAGAMGELDRTIHVLRDQLEGLEADLCAVLNVGDSPETDPREIYLAMSPLGERVQRLQGCVQTIAYLRGRLDV